MSSYRANTYILFLELPEEVSHKIDMIRSKYSNTSFPYQAHITVKQDEDYLIEADEFVQLVESLVDGLESVQVEINSVTSHADSEGYNIYLPVKSRTLIYLTRRLSRQLEEYIDPKSPRAKLSTHWEQSKDFYTHISIKGYTNQTLFEDDLNKIKNEDFKIDFPLELICQHLTIAQWHDGQWRALKTIKLG